MINDLTKLNDHNQPTEYSTRLANRIRELLEEYPDSLYCTFMTDKHGRWHMEEGQITSIDDNNEVYLSGGDQLHTDGSRLCVGRLWYLKEEELWKISNLYNKLNKHKPTVQESPTRRNIQTRYTKPISNNDMYGKLTDRIRFNDETGEIVIDGEHTENGVMYAPYIVEGVLETEEEKYKRISEKLDEVITTELDTIKKQNEMMMTFGSGYKSPTTSYGYVGETGEEAIPKRKTFGEYVMFKNK